MNASVKAFWVLRDNEFILSFQQHDSSDVNRDSRLAFRDIRIRGEVRPLQEGGKWFVDLFWALVSSKQPKHVMLNCAN
jgi:hypothetical protein